MAKTKISEFSSTPSNNTDIDGINIAEGMAPSNVNNAIRELMSQLKDWQSGAVAQDMTVNGGITATGNAVLSADLAVAGKATITGNATIGGAMTCSGATVLGSTLAVTGNATLGGNATVSGTLSATGATSLGAVTCSGAAVLSSTLAVSGNTNLAAVTCSGAVVMSSTLQVGTIKGSSSLPPTIKNSSGTEVGTFCRAWVNFNGTGTVAIKASFNVTSITDNGTGDYTINFTNAMDDGNYSKTCGVGNSSLVLGCFDRTAAAAASAPTTTSVRLTTVNRSDGAQIDTTSVNVSIFR